MQLRVDGRSQLRRDFPKFSLHTRSIYVDSVHGIYLVVFVGGITAAAEHDIVVFMYEPLRCFWRFGLVFYYIF